MDSNELALSLPLPAQRADLPPWPRESELRARGSTDGADSATADAARPAALAQQALVARGPRYTALARVIGGGRTVELAPLALGAAALGGPGARLLLRSPYRVLPHCAALAATPDGFVLALVTEHGLLYIVPVPHAALASAEHAFDAAQATIVHEHQASFRDALLAHAPSAHAVVVATRAGEFAHVDLPTARVTVLARARTPGLLQRVWGRADAPASAVTAVCALSDARLAVYLSDGAVQVWDLPTARVVHSLPAAGSLRLRPAQNIAADAERLYVARAGSLDVYTHALQRERSVAFPPELADWFVASVACARRVCVAFRMDASARVLAVDAAGGWTPLCARDSAPPLEPVLELAAELSVPALVEQILQHPLAITKAVLAQRAAPEDAAVVAALTRAALPAYLGAHFAGEDRLARLVKFECLCREAEDQASELLAIAAATEGLWVLRARGVSLLAVPAGQPDAAAQRAQEQIEAVAARLFGAALEPVLVSAGAALLTREPALARLDAACARLRPYIDQTRLTEVGNAYGDSIVEALRAYRLVHDPLAGAPRESSPAELSRLGMLAVQRLVATYAASEERFFLKLALLAVIATVEGWGDREHCSQELFHSVRAYRLLSFYTAYTAALPSEDAAVDEAEEADAADVANTPDAAADADDADAADAALAAAVARADLAVFGPTAARDILRHFDPFEALSALLRSLRSHLTLSEFDGLVDKLQPTASLRFLQALAALKAGGSDEAVQTLQRVSVARPWTRGLGPRPESTAQWYARVATYASEHGAQAAALRLAELASTLFTPEEDASGALRLLFDLALREGDARLACTALLRRFAASTESDEAPLWVERLIDAAAARGFASVRELLTQYPLVGFGLLVPQVLASKPLFGALPGYQLLYTWHIARRNYAAAATALYEHTQREPALDPQVKRKLYIICLNALDLIHSDDKYICCNAQIVTFDEIREQKLAIPRE